MDLYRYAANDRRGAFHYVRELAGGMLVALCGRQADTMRPLAAAAQHTECRRCAAARAELVEPAAVEAPAVGAVEEQPAAEQDAPALYRPIHSRRGAGHYRRPGTASSYCGRTVEAAPVGPQSVTGICQPCAKAEARDRVAAEQVAADHTADGPTLAERAGVGYALVGTGRRVHYSNNDDTLCGREVTRYTDGLDDRHDALCARCIDAAEHRAYARALADASPLAAAAVDLAETVEQADADREAAEERAAERQHRADTHHATHATAYELARSAVAAFVREMPKGGALRVPVVDGAPVEATLTRDDLHAIAYSGHTTAEAVDRVHAALSAHVRYGTRELHLMFPAQGMRPALYLPDVLALLRRRDDDQAQREAAAFARAGRAVDAVTHAEETGARVATVEDAEALYAAQLVTEADATAGTWRGEWIGDRTTTTAPTLFDLTTEQGALFA
jgi:hypothetical protein